MPPQVPPESKVHHWQMRLLWVKQGGYCSGKAIIADTDTSSQAQVQRSRREGAIAAWPAKGDSSRAFCHEQPE